MHRQTKAVMLHKFTFSFDEIERFGLESQQFEYMENTAREELRRSGLDYLGGEVNVDFGYRYRDTILTIAI